MKNLGNHVALPEQEQAEHQPQQLPAFTPGPWRVAPASHYAGSAINVDAGENGLAGFICETGHRGDHEAAANAYLIAAAPDMYAALTECQQILAILVDPANKGGGITNMAAWENCVLAEVHARAALRKARGEQ